MMRNELKLKLNQVSKLNAALSKLLGRAASALQLEDLKHFGLQYKSFLQDKVSAKNSTWVYEIVDELAFSAIKNSLN